MAATWRIRQFGGVALEGSDFEETGAVFPTQRSAKILILLSLVRDGRMRRDDLADTLWPGDYYDATRLRLRKELSRLRQTLGPAAGAFQADSETVSLNRAAFETDLEILRRTVALRAEGPRRAGRLREVAEICAGPFLPDWDDPWAVAERLAAENLRCQLLVAFGETLFAEGDAEGALAAVRPVIDYDPCRESARMVAIRAHAKLGSLTAALAEFQGMKRSMRDRNEGVPSAEAETLLDQIQKVGATSLALTHAPSLPALIPALDRFFGRREEMAALLGLLSPQSPDRLVCLVGTGGMGKSRLANEAAFALRDAYKGNVAFVSLAESPSAEAAGATLLSRLGWQGAGGADPVAVIASTLPAEPCLFVLDNLEHLLPKGAELVERLLQACPSLRLLATSRQSLRLAGERIVQLGPLDEAPEMMRDLAGAMRPELADDPDLAELARRLDGIPLALRLAAPRLRALGPKALLARLDDRFRLLQGGAPGLPERHRSLRAALDGSFEALGERERRALIRMAPFRGGWTLAHLESALPEEDGLAAMEALVDASLVAADDRGASVRFTMLETVREYVADREGGDEAKRAFVRTMADELRRWLPRPVAPRTWAVLEGLDAEADNLHVAAEVAIRLDPDIAEDMLGRLWAYDILRARHRDLQRLHGEFALAWPTRRMSGWAEYGRAAATFGAQWLQETSAAGQRAEQRFLESGDAGPAALAAGHVLVAQRRLRIHSPGQSADLYPALAERAAGEPESLVRILLFQGDVNYYAKRLATAADCLDRAIQLARESGDEVIWISAVHQRAVVALDLGEFEEARRLLADVAEDVGRLGDPIRLANQDELSGMAARGLGDDDGALARFRRCGEIWKRLGNLYQVAELANASARALSRLGRPSEARAAAYEAFCVHREVGQPVGVASALGTLAEALLVGGEPARAASAFVAARRMEREQGLEFAQAEEAYIRSLGVRLPNGSPAEIVSDIDSLFE